MQIFIPNMQAPALVGLRQYLKAGEASEGGGKASETGAGGGEDSDGEGGFQSLIFPFPRLLSS